MKSLVVATLIATVTLTASLAHAADVIRRLGKADFRGEITAMNPAKVTIDTNPVEEEVSVGDIDYISYDDESASLTNARNRVNGGQYEAALELLAEIDVDTLTRTEVIQDVLFYQAKSAAKLALAGSDQKNVGTVVAKLREFNAKHPGSYHFVEANLLLGDLAGAAGNFPAAKRFFGDAARAPWPSVKLEAQLSLALAYQRHQKWADALPLFKMVANSSLSDPKVDRLKLTARLGEAAALAGTGKLDEGLKIVEDVIITAEKGDYVLHGRAYNTLGAAYQAAQKPKDALLAYLHTDVLYFQDPDQHAEALANLAQLWAQVNKPQRQKDALQRLKTEYPNSRWDK